MLLLKVFRTRIEFLESLKVEHFATKSVALEKIRKVVQKQSAQPREQMLVYIVVYGIALALVLHPILLFIFVSFVLHFKTNQKQK